jgi:hypothetical protein
MKITYIFLLGLLVCTSSIHSGKPETNQSSTQDTVKIAETKRGWRGRRRRARKKEETPEATQKEVSEYLAVPNTNVSPVVVTTRPEDEKKLNLFFTNIEFTHSGISSFFNHTFNRKEYGTEFLPHNFTHLAQFIEYGQQAGQSKEFTEGVLRLFNQKLKMSSYVSAPAFERLLVQSSPYFEHQLAQKDFSLWKEIKTSLMTTFKTRFSYLQQNPMGFFDDISKDIAQKVSLQITTPDRVRYSLLRMLTSSCDKVVWSPSDQEQTWASFKTIGSSIERLHNKKVIPDDLDTNDLYWSLVERYAYFLDLVGSQLTLETCEKIKQDIREHKITWLQAPEQETGLQTKVERLAEVLLETEAKIRAGSFGLITDGVILS